MDLESAGVPIAIGDGVDHRKPQMMGEVGPGNARFGFDQGSAAELLGAGLAPQVVPDGAARAGHRCDHLGRP
jgi:hypothetical protein